jgi:hypothetical protein
MRSEMSGRVRRSRNVAWLLALVLAGSAAPQAAVALEPEQSTGRKVADWWSENFEVHGFLTTKTYFRSPDFTNSVELSSWRTELNLEAELRLYEGDDLRLGLYGVVRPIFESVYQIQHDLWGKRVDKAEFGTAPAYPDDPVAGNQLPPALGGPLFPLTTFADSSGNGRKLPCGAAFPPLPAECAGGRVAGEFTIVNSDTGSLFTGELTPAVSIDSVVFFGRVTAPIRPEGSGQDKIGGNATGETYEDLRDNFGALAVPGGIPNGGLPLGTGLDASLAMASSPLTTPLNSYQGGIGHEGSLKHGSFDINRNQPRLEWDCIDNAHPWCMVREFYLEGEYKDTFVRLGKQQIVWGKTDAFRLQDKINPIDVGYHNVFPDLEERRIPQLALDVIHSFGDVGPFQDVSLEIAWVFDRFIPDQFGQCGEPYAFTAACEARADAGGHQLFNFALANVDVVDWSIENTEPALRLEFRIPEPSIAFSLSAFYTHQDVPVARFSGHYSGTNPNPAAMLFLQGLFNTAALTPVAAIIDGIATGGAPFPACPDPGRPWLCGFDPYDHTGGLPTPGQSLDIANQQLLGVWGALMTLPAFTIPGIPSCGDFDPVADAENFAACAGSFAVFGMPWTASEVTLEYPRLWSLGASMDYQIPRVDTVLRIEMAADLDRKIQNTALLEQVDESAVFQAAIGLDRSTFIPFLNANRTAFISLQTFFEHIIDYDDGQSSRDGMVPWETTIISTAFMQNYWRNDSLILTSFVAVDWFSEAVIFGPSLRWVFNDHLFFDVGINLLWGKKKEHNLRDACSDQTLSCLATPIDPDGAGPLEGWQDGNWQTLNAGLQRTAQHPWWSKESFADKFMRDRDEFWLGVTYQF